MKATVCPAVVVLTCVINGWSAPPAAPIEQQASPPRTVPSTCDAPEHRQLDFWIGAWTVEAAGAPGAGTGTSSITRTQGGCVIFEDWSGFGVSGVSLNIYDRSTAEWRQTWADSKGGLHEYRGRRVGASMVFTGSLPPRVTGGPRRHTRMTLTALADDRVRQLSEESSDGGGSWSTNYDLIYVRTSPGRGPA